jgi:predicted kinase
MYQTLTLIRGLPGSGKSTLARAMCEVYSAEHFEADMWMVGQDGEYQFDPAKLPGCHALCQEHAEKALQEGRSVIVSNTFTRRWEMMPYIDMANRHGVRLQVITCEADFDSVHGVPAGTIAKMRERWEV